MPRSAGALGQLRDDRVVAHDVAVPLRDLQSRTDVFVEEIARSDRPQAVAFEFLWGGRDAARQRLGSRVGRTRISHATILTGQQVRDGSVPRGPLQREQTRRSQSRPVRCETRWASHRLVRRAYGSIGDRVRGDVVGDARQRHRHRLCQDEVARTIRVGAA
jgi:hypothetical protein